ncbi:MAG TPA: hypothetical protein VMV82_06075 [Candidatus Dormibacteraeota bacterium]|nr:hypothetical protein [Candidatus Dormibacteraeota bacterium]
MQTPRTTAISIPRGVVVPVLVTKDVRVGGNSSLNGVANTPVEFAVAQDVIWNGYVIAKAGDPVEGQFTNERNATGRVFSSSTSQEVDLGMDTLINFCGDTIHLHFTRTFVGGSYNNHVVSFFTFGLTGHHTNDAVFKAGKVLETRTDRFEKTICAEKTTALPLPLPTDMIAPDDELTPAPN